MVGIMPPRPDDINELSAHFELLYGFRRLQQLAFEFCFHLVSHQGADAREGLLTALAFRRLFVSVVVLSVVPSELRKLFAAASLLLPR